jgi:hypothetical protein
MNYVLHKMLAVRYSTFPLFMWGDFVDAHTNAANISFPILECIYNTVELWSVSLFLYLKWESDDREQYQTVMLYERRNGVFLFKKME